MRRILANYHVAILICYLTLVTFLAYYFESPYLRNPEMTLVIGIIPLLALFSFSFTNFKILEFPQSNLKINKFFEFYDYFLILLTSICFVSFAVGYFQNKELFESAFSYSLRLVTTALHPLYPLESRLFHTLIPFSLVTNFGKRGTKIILWCFYVLLVCLMQVKIAPLYLFLIAALSIIFNDLKFKALLIGGVLAGCLGMFFYTYKSSGRDFENLMKNDHLSKTMARAIPTVAPEVKSEFQINCVQKPDLKLQQVSQLYQFSKFANDFIYRTLVLPSIVSRVFVCAWENDFKGYFKGHQLARLTGNYVPIYNIIYTTYFPEQGGFAYGNAVGNYIFDAYLQLGLLGVIFSTLATLLILSLIASIPDGKEYKGLKNLMKINLLYGAITASTLSTLIFFVPLFLTFIYLKISERRNIAALT